MRISWRGWCLAMVLAAALLPVAGRAADDADIALIASRLKSRYMTIKFPNAESFLSSQQADGSWKDIDYADQSPALWKPTAHLQRVKEIAVAYETEGSPLYHGAAAMQGISNGLAFWFARKPTSTNWWHRQIGQQLEFKTILIVLGSDLSPELQQQGAATLFDPTQVDPKVATGQNLVWFCGEQLARGLVKGDEHDIAAAIDAVQKAVVVSPDEGIQSDFSFHQHGPQLYNGGYGMGFMSDSTYFASLTAGTRFAFPKEKIEILSHYLLEGTRRMVRGGHLDYSVIGRELARKDARGEAKALIGTCERMAISDPARKADYDALKATVEGTGEPQTFVGSKYFWNSDFMVEQRKPFYVSVKMNSARDTGTETINGENGKGYWLPFGVTYIEKRGDEHDGIFPLWNWQHLPGTTASQKLPEIKWGMHQPGTAVGGVSDGMYGAAAMDLELEAAPSLHAHKAWFFFDDEFVALGAGIASGDPEAVNTTVNQALLHGEVTVDGQVVPVGEHALKGVSWALHDGVGYFFPKKNDLGLSNAVQNGDWKTINKEYPPTPVSDGVFCLWIDHGTTPAGADYQYVVIPETDAARLAAYAKKPPVRVIANTTDLQAVRHDPLGIAEAVFYAPGQVVLREGLTLQVDQPCVVLVTEGKGTAKVSVGSLGGSPVVKVSLGGKAGMEQATFTLPDGMGTGSTVTQSVAVH